MAQNQNYQSEIKQPTLNKKSVLNLLALLFGLFSLLAIVTFVILCVKNYRLLAQTNRVLYDTSELKEYLTLQFQEQDGGVLLFKTSQVRIGRPGQVKKPANGFLVEVTKNGQSEFQTYISSDFKPLGVTVPKIPGSEIQLRGINSLDNSLTLKTDEISVSAIEELIPKPTGFETLNQALINTISQLKEKIISPFKDQGAENRNPLPLQAQKLVANIAEPEIIAANSEKIVWYYPETQEFVVIVLTADLEGVRQRTYQWLSAYGIRDQNSAKITFFQSQLQTQ